MFKATHTLCWLTFLPAAIFFAACDSLPRDQKGTLTRLKETKRLRVGLVENPPWVVRTAGEPAGAEVELVRRFAAENGAVPEWFWGSDEQHFEALERFELDLGVGGFNDATPWTSRIGLTSKYFENRLMVGFPPEMAPTEEIKGMQIAAENGKATSAFLEKKDAVPVRVSDLATMNEKMPVAADEWRLEKLGLRIADIDLHSEKHVFAVPPGENALIKKLDEFLAAQRGQIKTLLRQQEEFAKK